MRVAWITVVVLPLLAFVGCGGSGSNASLGSGCKTDTDCKGDRVCVSGSCMSAEAGASARGKADGAAGSGGASSTGAGGQSAGTGGGAAATGGASSSGGAGPIGGASGSGGAGGGGDAAVGPQCTQNDVSACQGVGLAACCTRAGRCGSLLPLLGCVATQAPGDAGTGGGGIVSAQCATCRAASCGPEASACQASAQCATLSSCIDKASPFGVLQCLNGLDPATTTLYNALSTCAKAHCASCPSINLGGG